MRAEAIYITALVEYDIVGEGGAGKTNRGCDDPGSCVIGGGSAGDAPEHVGANHRGCLLRGYCIRYYSSYSWRELLF